MADTNTFPAFQDQAAGAIPVRLVNAAGTAFYSAGGSASPPYASTPLGYQQITSLSASTALTVPGSTNYAVIVVEGQSVRYRDDGTAPTAAIGMLLNAGAVGTFAGTAELAALRFIQVAAGAILNISYYQ